MPKSSSNLRIERPRLRQEREDPAAPVVQYDEGAGKLGQVDQARHIVEEGQVPEEGHASFDRDAAATPRAVEITPSIPFAPRLNITRGGELGAANHSRSRTGMEADTTTVAPRRVEHGRRGGPRAVR